MNLNDVIRSGDFVVLDTETTGLHNGAEICQIAVIDSAGTVLLDTLVKPVSPIPADAIAIHGIRNERVSSAPGWGKVSEQLVSILTGRQVVIYNALFDRRLMHQSAEAASLPKVDWKTLSTFYCAMEAFAETYGDWNEYRHSYRWQSLATAAAYYSLPQQAAHTALCDCLTTLAVCKAMAEQDLKTK